MTATIGELSGLTSGATAGPSLESCRRGAPAADLVGLEVDSTSHVSSAELLRQRDEFRRLHDDWKARFSSIPDTTSHGDPELWAGSSLIHPHPMSPSHNEDAPSEVLLSRRDEWRKKNIPEHWVAIETIATPAMAAAPVCSRW
jgi:hypothetical protein